MWKWIFGYFIVDHWVDKISHAQIEVSVISEEQAEKNRIQELEDKMAVRRFNRIFNIIAAPFFIYITYKLIKFLFF